MNTVLDWWDDFRHSDFGTVVLIVLGMLVVCALLVWASAVFARRSCAIAAGTMRRPTTFTRFPDWTCYVEVDGRLVPAWVWRQIEVSRLPGR